MAESVDTPHLDESRSGRFLSRGDSFEELTQDLDNAFNRGDLPVARALSPLLLEIEERRGASMALARAYLKNNSLPVFEALQTMQHGREIDPVLSEELDNTYVDTAEHIAVLLKERNALPIGTSSYYNKIRRDITGGITELTTFGLFNRNGRHFNFLLTPSTDTEDQAGLDEEGKNKGFDFRAYPISPVLDLENPVKLQVKAGGASKRAPYQEDILVAGLNQFTQTPVQIYKELPYAIVHEARGTSRPKERALIAQTALGLSRHIWQHHSSLHKRQGEWPTDTEPIDIPDYFTA